MTDTIERNVTLNHDQELYVIDNGSGVSCLGFDVCLDRIQRISLELQVRGLKMPELVMARGDLRTYDTYRNLLSMLERDVQTTGERAVYDLSPQLVGLEGHRVEVVTHNGDTRRFIVGKSTGWAPCHLEIKRRDSLGGEPALKEYESVRDLGSVGPVGA